MRTVPRVNERASVNGGNVTDAGAPGGTETVWVSTARPSSSRRTCTLLTAAGPRFTTLAATVTRSWPEKSDRCGRTVATARFAVCASVIGIALNVVPSGRRRFSSRTQPLRWKSLIMITSRVCSVESARTRCASFSAGAYRVASAPTLAPSIAPITRERSALARTSAWALVPKRISVAWSVDVSPCTA